MRENIKASSTYLGLGIAFGALIGILTDNIGLWLPIGLAIGAGLTQTTSSKQQDKD